MGLRALAKKHARFILSEHVAGARIPMIIIKPDDSEEAFYGFSTDVHLLMDTDVNVSEFDREVSVTIPRGALIERFAEVPTCEPAGAWRVRVKNSEDEESTFSIIESRPDATIGAVVFILGGYEDGDD